MELEFVICLLEEACFVTIQSRGLLALARLIAVKEGRRSEALSRTTGFKTMVGQVSGGEGFTLENQAGHVCQERKKSLWWQ
jgi:hypothetical protein